MRLAKTSFGVFVMITAGIVSAQTFPALPVERAHLFATCAGRFEALVAHYVSTGHPDLAETRAMQQQFADLTQTVVPDLAPTGVSSLEVAEWQHRGQQEIAALILQIRMGVTIEHASTANTDFTEKLQYCAALVLPQDEE